jgi:phosphoribosylformylglycinamidine synthase
METKAPGNRLYIAGTTYNELGGSEYYRLKGALGSNVPIVRGVQAKKTFHAITKAIDSGFVRACHDVSEGGLAVSAAEMAMSGGHGILIDLKKVPSKNLPRNDSLLFSESNSRFLVEVPERSKEGFKALMRGVACAEIGEVTTNQTLVIHDLEGKVLVDTELSNLRNSWKETLGSGV